MCNVGIEELRFGRQFHHEMVELQLICDRQLVCKLEQGDNMRRMCVYQEMFGVKRRWHFQVGVLLRRPLTKAGGKRTQSSPSPPPYLDRGNVQ